MATNYKLSVGYAGTAADELDLLDFTSHFIVDGGLEFDHDAGHIRLTVLVLGNTANGLEANVSAIQDKLNQASTAFVEGNADEYVTFGVQRDTTSYTYYPVMGGTLAALEENVGNNKVRYLVTLDVATYQGRIVGYGAKETIAASGNLSNGAAHIAVSDVLGDLPARVRLVLDDTSVTNTLNRVYVLKRSGDNAGTADWDAWVDVTKSSGGSADATSFGGSYYATTVSSTAWALGGTALMPDGFLNQGRFHVYARVRDHAAVATAPTSGTAVATGSYIDVVQDVSSGSSSGGTSITATWGQATATNNTLIAAVKAHKQTTRYAISSITAGTAMTTVNTTEPHGLSTSDRVLIEGVEDTSPDINGTWAVTVTDSDTFTIGTGTSVGGSTGTVRETFYETVNQVPSGWVQIAAIATPQFFDPGQPAVPLDSTGWRFSPAEADTWDMTKLWVYAKPAGASESGGKTWGFDGSLTHRAAAMIEVEGVPTNTGGLSTYAIEQGESILSPPSVEANTLLIGINASKDQNWQPLFGFEQREDTTGLIVATKTVDEAGAQPWAAVPDDFDFPSAAALIGLKQNENPVGYALEAGTYQFRVQAVDATGNPGVATATFSATLDADNGAIALSWGAPSSPPVATSHYRITVSYDSKFYVVNTVDTTTSYTLTSLAGLETATALPSTSTASYTATPNRIRALVGIDGNQSAATNLAAKREVPTNVTLLGEWHHLYLGTFNLPPQRGMEDGVRPDWRIDLQMRNGGGRSRNVDLDALVLMPADEPGLMLEYPGLDLTGNPEWHWERDLFGRNTAWIETAANTPARQIKDVGDFELDPGDNVVEVVMEYAGGKSVLGTGSRCTLQLDYWPRYAHGKGQ